MDTEFREVEFGPCKVAIPVGGYYDRFRGHPDLDEVARDPAAGNIDWFRRIPKTLASSRVGSVWAPNFYYRTSYVQCLMSAPLARLRAALPPPLEPLQLLPGHGLVALTVFRYDVCDNDPYNEASIAVVLRPPGVHGPGPCVMRRMLKRRNVFAHVLALPVNTEIARVRGVHGYQFPKWHAAIDLRIGREVMARIDAPDGKPDLALQAPLPPMRELTPQSRLSTTTALQLIDGLWQQVQVHTNVLDAGGRLLPRDLRLQRGSGPMSQLLAGLGAGRVLRIEVMRDAQIVLEMPRPLGMPDDARSAP